MGGNGAGLVALDANGEVIHNLDVDVQDIAAAPDGGIWAVDGTERLRIGPDGAALLRNQAKERWLADNGRWHFYWRRFS